MTIKEEKYKVLIADDGKYLTNSDGSVYGTTIVLGTGDKASNYKERPLEEMPQPQEIEDPENLEDFGDLKDFMNLNV